MLDTTVEHVSRQPADSERDYSTNIYIYIYTLQRLGEIIS